MLAPGAGDEANGVGCRTLFSSASSPPTDGSPILRSEGAGETGERCPLPAVILGRGRIAPPQDLRSGAVLVEAHPAFFCPHCGHAMIVVQIFVRGEPIRAPPARPMP
jgi:hypothetical protein